MDKYQLIGLSGLSFAVGVICQLVIDTLYLNPLYMWSFLLTFWISIGFYVYVKYENTISTFINVFKFAYAMRNDKNVLGVIGNARGMTNQISLPDIISQVGNMSNVLSTLFNNNNSNPLPPQVTVHRPIPKPARVSASGKTLVIQYVFKDKMYNVRVPYDESILHIKKYILKIKSINDDPDTCIDISQQEGVPLCVTVKELGGYEVESYDANGVVVSREYEGDK